MGGGDRDLMMKEAAAIGGGDLTLKMETVAIRGDDPAGDLNKTTKMADAAAAGGSSSAGGEDTSKRNEAAASRQPWEEEGGILRLKKESLAVMDLWFWAQSPEWMAKKKAEEEKAEQALRAAGKKMKVKKTKVVKSRYPKKLIDYMAACSIIVAVDIPEERLAQRTPGFCKMYAAAKHFEAKNREYWHALVAQQKEVGYADDEIEVTDDEDEEDVMLVEEKEN